MTEPHYDQIDESPNSAVSLVRQKIADLYQDEPNAQKEIAEIANEKRLSKHQQFMYDLSVSGKSLAEIQTDWHNYYSGLPDIEKHVVWQEFYTNHGAAINSSMSSQPGSDQYSAPAIEKSTKAKRMRHKRPDTARSSAEIKTELLNKISSRSRPTRKQHFKSLIFGISSGLVVILLLLFSFFNERFIAPFITPSSSVSASPIIIDPATTAVGPESKIIIPKINAELPIDFSEASVDEKAIQHALESGVIHYPTTSLPGQQGNGAIFGHSSNNILNKGKYKFAFVLLKRLENGDTFMIQYGGKRYVYKVYDKQIVKPNNVSVLNNTNKPATFALITCDPPGTSLNRLVVWGEQISPDVSSNVASTPSNSTEPNILPSNAPSLWQRFVDWL